MSEKQEERQINGFLYVIDTNQIEVVLHHNKRTKLVLLKKGHEIERLIPSIVSFVKKGLDQLSMYVQMYISETEVGYHDFMSGLDAAKQIKSMMGTIQDYMPKDVDYTQLIIKESIDSLVYIAEKNAKMQISLGKKNISPNVNFYIVDNDVEFDPSQHGGANTLKLQQSQRWEQSQHVLSQQDSSSTKTTMESIEEKEEQNDSNEKLNGSLQPSGNHLYKEKDKKVEDKRVYVHSVSKNTGERYFQEEPPIEKVKSIETPGDSKIIEEDTLDEPPFSNGTDEFGNIEQKTQLNDIEDEDGPSEEEIKTFEEMGLVDRSILLRIYKKNKNDVAEIVHQYFTEVGGM